MFSDFGHRAGEVPKRRRQEDRDQNNSKKKRKKTPDVQLSSAMIMTIIINNNTQGDINSNLIIIAMIDNIKFYSFIEGSPQVFNYNIIT